MSNWSRSCVLVPIDFSETSWEALEHGRAIVDDPSHLHVIHVLLPLHPGDPGSVWDAVDDESRAESVTTALREKLDGMGLQAATVHTRVGDPGKRITDVAKSIHADLIVIASHGRTGLAHLLLGSVAERVARLAHCLVLIVRK
ncbi:MAG: universal stress protein [Alphaproteobacteria bacterium]|nr:universal stress protein [Alphaproteobacteria bacterium]